ncbi:MAG: phenylalanine--tRNA ligase subunit beta, partial [Bacteroidia bacterium]|nr:phenylalanine--tRNA ligase subunit beta [Bacteroidia bacterium]
LLRTDAAKIFEKGSDPNITAQVLKRAALLLTEFAGAKIESQIIDNYPEVISPKEIMVKYENVNKIIGTNIDKEDIHNILRAMKMELKPVDNDTMMVSVPTNKADVLREIDIIEEILRIYGFNKVPIPTQLKTAINYQNYPTSREVKNTIADLLANNGFNEMMGLSLIESKYYENKENLVYINNTSNIHLDIMRPDALLSGLISVAHNLNHQQTDLRLFEFGRTYLKDEENFKETDFLSLYITGDKQLINWNNTNIQKSDFFDIKKWVMMILDRINIKGFQVGESETEFLDYGLKYHRGPNNIVEFGKVGQKALKQIDIKQDIYYACFNLKSIVKSAGKTSIKIEEISKYPSTSRDLSLVIDEKVKFSDIIGLTKKTEKKLITEIRLFDIYKNTEQLGENKKAYAVKFVFQDKTKTLQDKDIEKVMSKLINNFGRELGALIRK